VLYLLPICSKFEYLHKLIEKKFFQVLAKENSKAHLEQYETMAEEVLLN
jgi:hypothetical protein